jgi:ribonuclease HI
MTDPSYFPRPPRPPGNPQPAPTFQAITRWLTPWRTIRRLEAENQRLREQIEALAGPAYRLRRCPTHGQQPPNAWGCPECVRQLRGELATAREALRRVTQGGWYKNSIYSVSYHDRVVEGVRRWARDGMTGPLPPLPDHIAKRDQPTTTEDLPASHPYRNL